MSAAEKIKRIWLSRREAIRLNRVGGEVPDPTPVHVPGKSEKPLTLREEMRRFVRQELSNQAETQGAGSFSEEDDFDLDEMEPSLISPYTVSELHQEAIAPQDDLEGAPTSDDLENGSEAVSGDSDTPSLPAKPSFGGEATASHADSNEAEQ